MNLPRKERVLSSAVVIALAAVLIVLAVVQYRWSGEVSEAASERMKAGLQASMAGFRQDLYREFAALCAAVPAEAASNDIKPDAREYVKRLRQWSRTTSHSGLIADLFVWVDAAGKHPQMLRLNLGSSQFETVSWPSKLEPLKRPLRELSPDVALIASQAKPITLLRQRRENGLDSPARVLMSGRDFADRPEPPGMPWHFDPAIPALIHMQIERGKRGDAHVNWIVIELNEKLLREQMLPDLAERFFGSPKGLSYDIAVVNQNDRQRRVIYASSRQLGENENLVPDGNLRLFGAPRVPPGPGVITREARDFHDLGDARTRGDSGYFGLQEAFRWNSQQANTNAEPARQNLGFLAPIRLLPFRFGEQSGDWILIAKHRNGSLEAAVAALRRRNLTISFGVLLLLATTMAMIITATRRAQRLAKLQMDFVAGVSHELRTPLAVIGSAADNLADGIIDNRQRLAQYGTVIKKQVRQLSRLIEQILLFAATGENRHTFNFAILHAAEIVDVALANTSELIEAAGFTVEQDIADDLPPVRVDLLAVSQCLQNLITNAVKYGGGEHPWIGIRARLVSEGSRGEQIQISVEDKGAGIAKKDLERIFDPFFRGAAATAAQIHGTGLGLSLARRIAEAMGGRLTVTSELGAGSSFVLHLPCANESALNADAAVTATGPGFGNRS